MTGKEYVKAKSYRLTMRSTNLIELAYDNGIIEGKRQSQDARFKEPEGLARDYENEMKEWIGISFDKSKEIASLKSEVDRLTAQIAEMQEALEKLARLGNEPHYGNSIGNQIAIEALAKLPKSQASEDD